MDKEMDDNLDLLDLGDDTAIDDALPAATPFAAPRPKKPWLLLGLGSLILVLAIFVIIRVIGSEPKSSIEIDLDAPVVTVDGSAVPTPVPTPKVDVVMPAVPTPTLVHKPTLEPQPAPVAQPNPTYGTPGVPVRVIEDRQDVTFRPDAGNKPAAKPAPKKVSQQKSGVTPAKKPAPKKPQNATRGSWYVQFGSYSTRSAAENAEKKIRAAHSGLFAGKQFVILAAQLPNGTTTYRLRIAFADANEANGFCRNAKSDGLDCYVAK